MTVLELVGYLASVIIAVSIAMTSIVKFRLLNCIGAALFSAYGFIIGAIPVGILNGFIAIINIFYLFQMFNKKEVFDFLLIEPSNPYLFKFIDFHQLDIKKFFPSFSFQKDGYDICLLMLRNASVAGVFLGRTDNEHTLWVELDFVTSEYRDMKNGRHLYRYLQNILLEKGVFVIKSLPHSKAFTYYMKKVGFEQDTQKVLSLELKKNG